MPEHTIINFQKQRTPAAHTPMHNHQMRMQQPNFIQRKCAQCDAEEKAQRKPAASFIQKKETGSATTAPAAVSSQIEASKGGGQPMSGNTRSFMEGRFGADFSGVRIHTGNDAAHLSAQLNAQAFTVGNDIYFNNGQYAPESTQGQHLLAHELTHTLQQNEGIGRKMIQRMAPCPAHLNDPDPVPPGWVPYHGDSYWFHCGFRGILEDRRPSPQDPMNECFYDHSGVLVDRNHTYPDCAGTPDDYDSSTNAWDHTWHDRGGIWHKGWGAFWESRRYNSDREAERMMECYRGCESQPWYLRGFCYQGCNPQSMMMMY